MIGRLNHVAIAVRDIGKAAAVYRDTLGAEVSAATAQSEHVWQTVLRWGRPREPGCHGRRR
jgi:methylmalonyl-CoA/ethylmalonyl-CoA epimerase